MTPAGAVWAEAADGNDWEWPRCYRAQLCRGCTIPVLLERHSALSEELLSRPVGLGQASNTRWPERRRADGLGDHRRWCTAK
jgi:hypothetical protein